MIQIMRAINYLKEMSRRLHWSIKLIIVVLVVNAVFHRPLPREPLDRLWEEHMLTRTSGIYSAGIRTNYQAKYSFEVAKGSPMQAWLTKEGIDVGDKRETSMFGLLRAGGWSMFGGLLASVEDDGSTFELYGKVIDRELPKPIFLIHFGIPGGFAYEFYLLRRQKGIDKAVIVKKWTLDRLGLLKLIFLDWPNDVRGLLQYDSGKKIVTVTITFSDPPLQEHLDVSKLQGS